MRGFYRSRGWGWMGLTAVFGWTVSLASAQDTGETPANPPAQVNVGGEAAAGSAGGTASVEADTSSSQPPAASPGANAEGSTEAEGEVPWAGAQATPPPAFLDTTDRRIEDTRPPPPPEQVAALREMEAEVARFSTAGQSYRDTVLSIVRREYLRQRRAKDQTYARQISEEERLQNEAREEAIRLFERFVRQYPDDPTYTPDAMFRLGELYFERSAIQFQDSYDQAQAARERGEDPGQVGDAPDFVPTIELYQRLVSQFPDYRKRDGVYYLIGYCLNEMGRSDEARLAWLNLVCANKFTYDPQAFAAARAEEAQEEGGEAEADDSPALTLDGPPPSEPGIFVDPYAQCEPVMADAEFISETWFRVGEYHFDDYGGDHALDLAISAYNRILLTPEDRNYNLALYKVAWAYYRASRYPEAIRHFGMLVQWSDDERQRTGRAGSELRPEAIQYLGIAFAYDDWNENQVPDPLEGSPTGLQRIQDAALLPQDRAWTPEVYFQLGNVYFDENKLPEAIAVWQVALERWPNDARAPEITNMIARAHARNQEMEEAIAYRAKLGDFGQGSDWWNANVENPAEQRKAEQLAENALIGTAVHYHQEAQRLRRQCVSEQDPILCTKAEENYSLAAKAYRGYLDRYPNNPQAYELRYNLADALYWSENYEEAAQEYALVRDSNLDDRHLSESARRVVEALKRIVDREADRGAVTIREEPPEPQGQPPKVLPVAMPELVQRLAQARELYLARVSERDDTENVREAYDYNNTLLLYFYGYWDHARERFQRIFNERCVGPNADETGRVAWLNLRNIAAKLGDIPEAERLARELQERKCTFAPDGQSVTDVDCSDPANRDEPNCVALETLNAARYRRALDIYKRAEGATGDEQRRMYERAATMLVRAVDDNPNDPQAPIALEYAATALERTSRFESAGRLYQRIIDEVGPRKAADDAERDRLTAILANAHFRLAFNANRFFDFDRAVENYRLLADNQRFASSTDATVVEKREDALINAAIILERQQQYPAASTYYRRAAETLRDDAARMKAHYSVAEITYKRGNANATIRAMREFISRYRNDAQAGELVVQAYWRIAQVRKKGREYQRALQDVVTAYSQSRQPPGSMAAEYAAHAKFILADGEIGGFESFSINPGRPRDMKSYVGAIRTQINQGSSRAQTIVGGYEPVLAYRRPVWTIASYVRQGRAYEVLARAILNTPFTLPSDVQRQLRRLGPDQKDEIRMQVEGEVQAFLDEQIRPIECFAVQRYALASRAARAGNVGNEYTAIAIDRLQAYGEERIAECIALAQQKDASFQAYQAGEFARALRGRNLEMRPGAAPPPLAKPEGR